MPEMIWKQWIFKLASFIFLLAITEGRTISNENPVESPLLVGAFNIQNLGKSKMENVKVMNIIKKILLRYDLVLVQEIVTTNETLMSNLIKDLNKLSPKETKYMLAISERLGRGTAKEQYAYIYKSEKLKFLSGTAFPDKDDEFMRPPYIAHFATPTLRDMYSMLVIGVHTQPKNAANETSSLAGVYDYAVKKYRIKDAIIMGDMNAGCSNVRIGDWENIELWQRQEFTWLITHNFDTTLSTNCCPYDRIVIAGENMESAVIWRSVGVFDYQEEYDLKISEALNVSDHWPVEVKLKGKVSKEVHDNIRADVCVAVVDSTENSIPAEIQKQKTTMGFKIQNTELTSTLQSDSTDLQELLQSLQKLQAKYSQMLSKEITAAVVYKVTHGVLEDESSHSFPEDKILYSVTIEFDRMSSQTSIRFCSETTVN